MCPVARVAVGTIQSGADRRFLLGALYGLLARAGIDAQPFLSRACFASGESATLARPAPRHLDSWLMTRNVCIELFRHGAQSADLALVEGELRPRGRWEAAATPCANYARGDLAAGGACLESLCEWLDLPVVALVDVSRIAACALPAPPCRLAGVLLDRVAHARDAARWRTVFESLWDAPVLGFLDEAPHLRAMAEAADSGGAAPGVWRAAAERLAEHFDVSALLRLAEHRPWEGLAADTVFPLAGGPPGEAPAGDLPLNVAVALDQAFHRYFPDTLDLLEARGATLCDFSPLRDDALPPQVDVVYLGCGCPEQYADPLAENHCMKQALRSFVEAGGRVYAEGGGLAYLCQQIVLPTGRRLPMVGAVPAVAIRSPHPQAPQPVEVTLNADTWLARRDSRLRGYLNLNWRIQPVAPLAGLTREDALPLSLLGRRRVVGSRLYLNFAAQPAFLRGFFQPVPLVGNASAR